MDALDVIIITAVFYFINRVGKSKDEQVVRSQIQKNTKLNQYLHQWRSAGVNREICESMADELQRRGAQDFPYFGQGIPPDEVAARLQLQLEATPYVYTNNMEPGEDKTLAKSTYQLWPRGVEQDDN